MIGLELTIISELFSNYLRRSINSAAFNDGEVMRSSEPIVLSLYARRNRDVEYTYKLAMFLIYAP